MSNDVFSSSAGAYMPGVCNINHAEIARRRKAGYIGLAVFVVIGAVLWFVNIRWLRIVLFFPAFMAAIGFLQARNRFCVGYAAAGKQNADEGSTAAHEITDQTAQQKDKRRARTMNLQAAGIALLVTAIVLLLPVSSV